MPEFVICVFFFNGIDVMKLLVLNGISFSCLGTYKEMFLQCDVGREKSQHSIQTFAKYVIMCEHLTEKQQQLK